MKVSVIIPSFRAGRYIEESVSSVQKQQFDGTLEEIIIVDDGSDDVETLDAYDRLSRANNVRLLKNEGIKGSAGARNTGIRAAKGDWIAFLDADDWWTDGSLQARIDALNLFQGTQWVGGDFVEWSHEEGFNSEPRFKRNLNNYTFLSPAYEDIPHPILLEQPLKQFLVQAPTHTIVGLISKALLQRAGGFSEHLLRQQDIHLFLRLANISDFAFTPYVVAVYRHHETNSTRSLTHTQEWRICALNDLIVSKEFQSVKNLIEQQIFTLHLSNSYEFRRDRDFKSAKRSASAALTCSPFSRPAWKSYVASILNIN